MKYHAQYINWINKFSLRGEEMEGGLWDLVAKYNQAYYEWQDAPEKEQEKYLTILMLTDAFLSASIYKMYKDRLKEPAQNNDKISSLKTKLNKLNF